MSAVGDWSDWSKSMYAKTSTPLSSAGPLAPEHYALLPHINDFGRHLQAFGLFTPLGPLGPLGVTGVLGPLGPMGIHGYQTDKNGNYLDKNHQIVRTVTYPYDATTQRTWELYESYPSIAAAKRLADKQDSSFMVRSVLMVGIGYIQSPDVIPFRSHKQQYITIVVTPDTIYDSFVLEVRDVSGGGTIIASSDETFYINWVQFKAPIIENAYEVIIRLGASSRVSPIGFGYRCTVTGGSDLIQSVDISGDHIVRK